MKICVKTTHRVVKKTTVKKNDQQLAFYLNTIMVLNDRSGHFEVHASHYLLMCVGFADFMSNNIIPKYFGNNTVEKKISNTPPPMIFVSLISIKFLLHSHLFHSIPTTSNIVYTCFLGERWGRVKRTMT